MKRYQFSLAAFMVLCTLVGLALPYGLSWASPAPEPIRLENMMLMGKIFVGEPFSPILSEQEARWALEHERVDEKLGRLTNVEVLDSTTRIDLPRDVPLIGVARLHTTTFLVAGEFIDKKGTTRQREFLVTKNQFVTFDAGK